MAELDRQQAMALEQMGEIGEPNKYCRVCNDFYLSRKENSCILEGCKAHESCLKCSLEVQTKARVSFCSLWDHGEVNVHEEQHDWPCENGYVSCWICKKMVCNRHFKKHYVDCRNKVSTKCGFRPPRRGNDYKGRKRVKGHCGKVAQGTERTETITFATMKATFVAYFLAANVSGIVLVIGVNQSIAEIVQRKIVCHVQRVMDTIAMPIIEFHTVFEVVSSSSD